MTHYKDADASPHVPTVIEDAAQQEPSVLAKTKGGRPPYRRDERIARQVEAMSGFGIPHPQIAKVIGVCENTLRKYYRDELDLGATKANAKVIENLFRKATSDGQGSVAAAIFWTKARCGWRETQVTEHAIAPLQREPLSAEDWLARHGGPTIDHEDP